MRNRGGHVREPAVEYQLISADISGPFCHSDVMFFPWHHVEVAREMFCVDFRVQSHGLTSEGTRVHAGNIDRSRM